MKKATLLLMLLLTLAFSCKRSEKPASGERDGDSDRQEGKKSAQAATGSDVGSIMPEYAAMWLDGSKFDLASKRDKVVLLNVWATWCGPCRYEIPELQAIHNKYAPKGFEVIGVSVDESGVEPVKQFVDQQKMTYPVALDAEGKLANMLQTSVLPTSVILDRSGKIVWKKFGAIMPNDPELTKAIEAAL
ncbi:MAG: TlpA family protein disulfide reductase [Acidobacteriota bacterium]|nr:TlpA family protein disulfide reductase [Acidobacteriota bacterium]